MAYSMLLVEMLENQAEVKRIVTAMRRGSLTLSHPVFGPGETLNAENWQLLAQGPLVEHLSPDLFLRISLSYGVSRRFVDSLGNAGRALGVGSREAWKALCGRHLAEAENALEIMNSAYDELYAAQHAMEGG
jgi:hypothetical protein